MSESSYFLSKGCWPQSRIVYIIRGMGLDNRIWAVTLEFANSAPPPPPISSSTDAVCDEMNVLSWAEYPIKKKKKKKDLE